MGLTAKELMEEYEDRCDRLALLQAEYARRVEVVMATVKEELDALDVELKPILETATTLKTEIEAELKTAVLAEGATIKGARLMAVWAKGRETWQTDKLAGFALAHPELLELRKVGEPTVSIRAIK